MAEDRVVQVALQMIYDARSARAFQQLAQDADKAAKAVQKELEKMPTAFQRGQEKLYGRAGIASNIGAYGTANTIGRVGGLAQGAESMGFGSLAGGLQRAAVPAAVIKSAIDAAAKVAVIAQDEWSNKQQKSRALFRALPGGEYAQEKYDAFTGRAAGMEGVDIRKQFGMRDVEYYAGLQQQALGFNPGQAGREAYSRAFRGQSPALPSVFDRTNPEGQRLYEQQQRILPLRQAELKAERELKGATAERVELQKQIEKISVREINLYKERMRLEGDKGGSGVSEAERISKIEQINAELNAGYSARRQGTESLMGLRQKEAGAGAEVQRAKLRTRLEGEAMTAERRVAVAESAGERLGGMNIFDREMGLQAARMIKARGSTEGVPQEFIQAARNFAPNFIGNIIKKSGQRSTQFAAGFNEFGEDDFGTLDVAGEDRRAQQARRELAKGEFAIDAKLSEEIARTGRDFGKYVGEVLYRILETAKSEIEQTIRQGRPQR
jgi:hypothetical protein